VLNNTGTMEVESGTLSCGRFVNDGTLDVQAGRVLLTGGGGGAGTFRAAAGATLGLASGRFSFNGASFLGSGTSRSIGNVTIDGSLISQNFELMAGTLSGTHSFAGRVNWTGGTMAGGQTTIAPGAVLNVSGAAEKGLRGHQLDNEGTVLWTGDGAVRAEQVSVVN